MRVATRADLTLEAVRGVAWDGEPVELAPAALEAMDRRHASFLALVEARLAEDPGALIYGVTTAPGDGAAVALTAERAARRPRELWTAASFGEPLPERVARAIVLARLANFVEGHAAVRGEVGVAVAEMLGGGPLPAVPARGNGGAGEILALGNLFYGLSAAMDLHPKERMALVNGSPCAAALVADVALAGRGRLALAEALLALAADVLGVPLEHYAPELEALWGDEHEAAALRSLRALLAGSQAERQGHQAPVSFRILPRVLGGTRRAQAEAEAAAGVSLAAVTDNPVYLPPTADRPLGAIVSTGGYHDTRATTAIDGQAFAWADLCQLVQRASDKLLQHPATAGLLAPDEWTLKPLHMVQAGWAEEARSVAQPTLLSLAGFGQNDVASGSFRAWDKAATIGECLDAALAGLAAMASQALHGAGRPAPPALGGLVDDVRAAFPPVAGPRRLGEDGAALAAAFSGKVLSGAWPAPGRST